MLQSHNFHSRFCAFRDSNFYPSHLPMCNAPVSYWLGFPMETDLTVFYHCKTSRFPQLFHPSPYIQTRHLHTIYTAFFSKRLEPTMRPILDRSRISRSPPMNWLHVRSFWWMNLEWTQSPAMLTTIRYDLPRILSRVLYNHDPIDQSLILPSHSPLTLTRSSSRASQHRPGFEARSTDVAIVVASCQVSSGAHWKLSTSMSILTKPKELADSAYK